VASVQMNYNQPAVTNFTVAAFAGVGGGFGVVLWAGRCVGGWVGGVFVRGSGSGGEAKCAGCGNEDRERGASSE